MWKAAKWPRPLASRRRKFGPNSANTRDHLSKIGPRSKASGPKPTGVSSVRSAIRLLDAYGSLYDDSETPRNTACPDRSGFTGGPQTAEEFVKSYLQIGAAASLPASSTKGPVSRQTFPSPIEGLRWTATV